MYYLYTRVFLEGSVIVNTYVVRGCRAGYRKKKCERKKERLSIFHIPKDESLRNIWIP